MKNIPEFEDFITESNYTQKDFSKDNLIHFKDGEVWIVVEPGMRNSNDRRGPNEITIKPFNKLAKDKNVSLPIDVDMKYLNDNVTKVENK